MPTIIENLVIIFAVIGLSFACSILRANGFSLNVFLTAMSIGIAVLVWIPVIPSYMIVFSVLAISGMLFSDSSDGATNE